MREYLFRGIEAYNGEWVEGCLISIDLETCSKVEKEKYTHCIVEPNTEFYRGQIGPFNFVIPETIGQYTGLTDKNGTKIFEGDKCRVTRHCILCYGSITFKNGSFWFDEFNTDSVLELSKLKINNFEIEVIGNIHDNPELLEA